MILIYNGDRWPKQVSGLGRLKLSDFRDFMASLKQWQAAFKSHTKEKTGILRAERLRDSLFDVGTTIFSSASSFKINIEKKGKYANDFD